MSAIQRTMRTTSTTGAALISELWRGQVVEVFDDNTAQVVVPRLTGEDPIGRIPSLVPNLALGARVIVGAIEGRIDDLVVLSAVNAEGLVVGDARFTDVLLDNPPTLDEHAARKSYVDEQIATRSASSHTHTLSALSGNIANAQMPLFVEIPTAADLNNYITDGTWHQSQNVDAAAGFNYPVAIAGLLTVQVFNGFIYQQYRAYNSGRTYWRVKYGSTWYAWQAGAWSSELVDVTQSTRGFMLAADKVKLDGASATTVNNSLVLRSASGHISANVFLSDAAQSTAVNSMTRRDYVDAQIATRAAAAHTHAAADISDSSVVGRSVVTAVDAAEARAAIGAGTSSLVVGTGASNAKAGNWFPSFAEVTGTVSTSQLPPLAINETFQPADQAAMLALTAQRGDMAIRLDNGRTYVLSADAPGTLANWKEIMAAGQVQSVAGKTGVVLLVKADVGLSAVDNTSDLAKPISTATQAALDGKSATSHTHAAATSGAAGFMSAADKAKLDAATNAATASTLVMRSTGGAIAVNTGTGATDAANKQYVDNSIDKPRIAEYLCAAVQNGPGSGIYSGVGTLEIAENNTFVTPKTTGNRGFIISEAGGYSIDIMWLPANDPGNCTTSMYVNAIRVGTFSRLGTYGDWEFQCAVPYVRVPAGATVEFLQANSGGVACQARVKIAKRAG